MKRKIKLVQSLDVHEVEDEYFVTNEMGIPMYIFTVNSDDGEKFTLTCPISAVLSQIAPQNENHMEMLRASSDQQLENMLSQIKAQEEIQNTPEPKVEHRDYI